MAAELYIARRVRRFSRAHNGAIDVEHLLYAGLTRSAIRARVRRGRLVLIFTAVYAVGDPELLPLVRQSGALLSVGSDSVISQRSAAAVWRLAEVDPNVIDVTVIGRRPRPRTGVKLHYAKTLTDITTHQNLRLTNVPRTLIDFAAQASASELTHAFGEARAKWRLTDPKLKAALKRTPRNHPGAAIVRAMLAEGGTYDRSKAERLMRTLCRQAELPQPVTNVMLNGHLVDFLWPDRKLIVEIDGYGTHGTRQAFEADRRRDRGHIANGYAVIRITWAQLENEPMAVIAAIAQALARRAA